MKRSRIGALKAMLGNTTGVTMTWNASVDDLFIPSTYISQRSSEGLIKETICD